VFQCPVCGWTTSEELIKACLKGPDALAKFVAKSVRKGVSKPLAESLQASPEVLVDAVKQSFRQRLIHDFIDSMKNLEITTVPRQDDDGLVMLHINIPAEMQAWLPPYVMEWFSGHDAEADKTVN